MKFLSLTILLVVSLVLIGCEEPTKPTDKLTVTPKVEPGTSTVEKVERFTVKSMGTFEAGYDNAKREIFIMKDTQTGAEYIGITDCALIRLVKKKNDEKAEAVSEVLEGVADALGDE